MCGRVNYTHCTQCHIFCQHQLKLSLFMYRKFSLFSPRLFLLMITSQACAVSLARALTHIKSVSIAKMQINKYSQISLVLHNADINDNPAHYSKRINSLISTISLDTIKFAASSSNHTTINTIVICLLDNDCLRSFMTIFILLLK